MQLLYVQYVYQQTFLVIHLKQALVSENTGLNGNFPTTNTLFL